MAAMALIGCSETKDVRVAPETVDKISVAPTSETIDAAGGDVKVIVSSTAEWTLAGKADYSSWVTASAANGVDGDIVTFTVEPNATDSKLNAEWTFTCGKATATYVLTSLPAEVVPDQLSLVTAPNVILDYNTGRLEVVASSTIFYRKLTATLSDGASEWLTYRATLEGDNEGEAKFVYDYSALESLDDRTATITISGEGVESVQVAVSQEAKHRLETSKQYFTAELTGETIEVPMTVNVKYSITISDEGKSWIEHVEFKDGSEFFKIAAFDGDKRSATITFTQTDAEAGETPLSAQITVSQLTSLIQWAVRMNSNRIFPKWDGTEKPGTLSNFTLECMIRPESFKTSGSIMTIMGIEGQFLLRFGDVGNNPNRIQIATSKGNYNIPKDVEANKWTHVAVAFDGSEGRATAYFDGEEIGSYQFSSYSYYLGTTYLSSVNLSPAWSYEPTGVRCFWIGYSYETNRDFYGLMTEFRIWNKTLTKEEINATNHFYTVDPQSEGLFAYWKVTSGEGNTIADATGRGNNLYGEQNITKQSSGDNVGTDGITFEEVALPEN